MIEVAGHQNDHERYLSVLLREAINGLGQKAANESPKNNGELLLANTNHQGLTHDAIQNFINIFTTLGYSPNELRDKSMSDSFDTGSFRDLPILDEYEAYLFNGFEWEIAITILESSSPEKITAYNALAKRYNADRSRIIKEQNVEGLLAIYDEAEELIRPERVITD